MSTPISSIIERIAAAGTAYESNQIGSRESLIELSRDLIATLEIPSEFLQRSFWAEPALSAHCKYAVQVKLFQHLRDAGDDGVGSEELAEKTGTDVLLLERIMRHLIAMKMITFFKGRFFGTALSHGLAADNYQQSIDFCYDVARPAFNVFPEHFKKAGYRPRITFTNGPLQAAHGTDLPFFDWLVATPPHLEEFDAFMSAYRAGKADWCSPGFYPVEEQLIQGFDPSNNEVLLVDVGKLVLQDREAVITSIQDKQALPFGCATHDFFTPQPIQAARAYLLHSILHDWDDEAGIRILENLKPALKAGYSRVLLNEIVLSEENPTIAATSMDMMMMAHMGVRERTEVEWKAIIAKAGLRFVRTYSYPGVAESVIEAELL
ncbi:putative hydroxyindole O-methyltransferase [Aureobasidium pullulans]|uniref:Putative hydroxyindole O-methyltransferase n=1 Tax=Aureobasidium pullulans TaxID=5580 RepID=A0A4S9X762_AURPU|nr:putative hydroxyindole O-methyltransferase [Aureobasidium pullulans]